MPVSGSVIKACFLVEKKLQYSFLRLFFFTEVLTFTRYNNAVRITNHGQALPVLRLHNGYRLLFILHVYLFNAKNKANFFCDVFTN